jgi:hypothetical protein
VADDFAHALGDPLEGRLASALAYRDFGNCPVASGMAPRQLQAQRAGGLELAVPEVRRLRILR